MKYYSNSSIKNKFVSYYLKDEDEKVPEDSLTSKEFDRFLAERAAAAENLPNLPNPSDANSSSGTPHKKTTPKKDEESLLTL